MAAQELPDTLPAVGRILQRGIHSPTLCRRAMRVSRDIDLLVLVCPNGFGHFRRQVEILSRLLNCIPDLRVHLLCADAQVAATSDWVRARRFFSDPRVTRTSGVLDPGVSWFTDPARYEGGVLTDWMDRCERLPEIDRARLVVSDNLGSVLAIRPDALLTGSFLWGDVLSRAHPTSKPVRAFAELESQLLERNLPPMLCVKDVAMPAVLASTAAVPVGWMCEPEFIDPPPVTGAPRVGLFGGATGAAATLLDRCARALARTDRYQLVLPAGLPHGRGIQSNFGHGREDYSRLSVAVCRPGLGTVTSCIAQGTPMVTLHEGPINPELAHIGARLSSIGAAIDLGPDPSDASVVAAVARILVPEVSARMRANLRELSRDGLAEATNYLAARLEGAPAVSLPR